MRIKQLQQKRNGFTLVELILYLGMAALLVTTTTLFLNELTTARIKSETVFEVEQQGSVVMSLIEQTIHNGLSISSPSSGTSATTVSIKMAAAGENPTDFTLTSGTITVKRGASTAVNLTNTRVTASALTFTNLSRSGTPGTIRFQFTLTSTASSARNEFNYSRTFYGSASLR